MTRIEIRALSKRLKKLWRKNVPDPADSNQPSLLTDLMCYIRERDVPGYQQICQVCEQAVNQMHLSPDFDVLEQNSSDSELESIIQHYPNLGALASSAKAGCHLCSVLAKPLCEGQDGAALMSYVLRFMKHPSGPSLFIQLASETTQITYLDHENTEMPMGQTLLCERTDESAVLNLAKEWLGTCTAKHAKCREVGASQPFSVSGKDRPLQARFFPRRLIHVRSDGNSASQARLVQGASISTQNGYLTLSHCWGGADVVKLTTLTLKIFEANIPLSDLPKSFMDALFVTARLGFEYIWIDSLCIMQDSDEDWKRESEQMGRIYWYSDCTIAAVKAHNSHEGLFSERYPLSFIPYCLPKFQDDNVTPSIYATKNLISIPRPLYTRAWAVQERCLSRRTINFAADMISWECITGNATEAGTKDAQRYRSHSMDFRDGSELKATLNDILSNRKRSEPEKPNGWLDGWREILRYYTKCDLTFSSDRFEAIRGLTKLVQEARNLAMVEGLWHPYLITELLWSSQRPQKERYVTGSPSWSWIGIPGEVSSLYYPWYKADDVEATAVVLDRSVAVAQQSTSTLMSHSPLKIQVTARLLPISHLKKEPQSQLYPFHFLSGGTIPTRDQMWYWNWYWQPDVLPKSEWDLWALQVIPNAQSWAQTTRFGVGLIILPIDGEKDLFQRVGSYKIRWNVEEIGDSTSRGREPSTSEIYSEGTIHREFGEMRTIQLI